MSHRRATQSVMYPTLSLYRRILRAHEHFLPQEQRELGDAYVKTEFRLHRGASSEFLAQFERQWRDYLTLVTKSSHESLGRELTPTEVAALSDEQKVQLLRIKEEAVGPSKVKA